MDKHIQSRQRAPARQRGAFTLEFAIVFMLFLTMIVFVLEVARAMYMWQTLQEASRRAAQAAAVTDFTNESAKAALRQAAIFRTSAGGMMLGSPITDANVVLDYMWVKTNSDGSKALMRMDPSSLPASPAQNRMNCTIDSGADNCIQFVRVRICADADSSSCDRVPYEPMLSLVPLAAQLPTATSLVKAQSLGYRPGQALLK